jgi:hypothetical protein
VNPAGVTGCSRSYEPGGTQIGMARILSGVRDAPLGPAVTAHGRPSTNSQYVLECDQRPARTGGGRRHRWFVLDRLRDQLRLELSGGNGAVHRRDALRCCFCAVLRHVGLSFESESISGRVGSRSQPA